MAKAQASEARDARDENADGPLLDTMGAAVKKMVTKGKERGYVTYDELNAALPPEEVSSEQIEDTMAMLSEMGINCRGERRQKMPPSKTSEPPKRSQRRPLRAGNVDESDLGRTDDPVRMYLREMGRCELLSREGEIAIAKRIEAGRDMMIGGDLRKPADDPGHRPLARCAGREEMLLRDVIDLGRHA